MGSLSGTFIQQLKGMLEENKTKRFPNLEVIDQKSIGPFKIIRKAGDGSFSTVFLANGDDDITNYGQVALKMIPFSTINQHEEDSVYFPKFYGLVFTNTHVVLVMEAISNGVELFDYLSVFNLIQNQNDARIVVGEIANAVQFLHSIGIIHRDLKLENIFLTLDPKSTLVQIKLIDFGFATYLPIENATEIISFELLREFDRQLTSFWEIVLECSRPCPFFRCEESIYILRHHSNLSVSLVGPKTALEKNFQSIFKILHSPLAIDDLFHSNQALYKNTLLQNRFGSEEYAAPELLLHLGRPYSGQSTEAWSLGVIAYLILVGRFPFQYKSPVSFRSTIAKGVIDWSFAPPGVHMDAKILIEKLLDVNPSDRLTIEGLLASSWLSPNSKI